MDHAHRDLHPSLIELSDEAQSHPSLGEATARGIVQEAAQLVRNAFEHGSDAVAVSRWYSAVISTIAARAGLPKDGTPLFVVGCYARGEALPGDTLTWIAPGPSPDARRALASAGVCCTELILPSSESSGSSLRAERINMLVDVAAAGARPGASPSSYDADLIAGITSYRARQAMELSVLASHQHTLTGSTGLMNSSTLVDIDRDLLAPISTLASWGTLERLAACPEGSTIPRTTAKRLAELSAQPQTSAFHPSWGEDLREAFDAALALRSRHWLDGMNSRPVFLGDLPGLHRSLFGAASRLIGGVYRGIQAANSPVEE